MSKLDYLTIVIVALCLAAVVFIFYRIYDLGETENPIATPPVRETPEETTPKEEERAPATDLTPSRKEEKTTTTSRPQVDKTPEQEVESREPEVQMFLVLAGSFRLRSGADAEVDRLKSLGYENAEVTLFNTGTFAAVLVDRFEDLARAEALVKELKQNHNVDAYVHEKRSDTEEN